MSKQSPTKEVKELPEDDPNGTNRRRSSRIATRRASSTAEDTPVKITKGRRASASQESVGSLEEDIISSSQNEPSPKLKVSTRSTKSPARLNKASDEIKGTPRITRNKGSISSNDDIKKEVTSSPAGVTTRRRSLRAASTSPTSDLKPTAISRVNTPRKSLRAVSVSPTRSEAAKSTPKRGRRGSVTERLVLLEAIEETENKTELSKFTKDNDEVDDVFLSKKKKAVVAIERKQDLQPITEKSFSEESESSSTADKEKSERNLSKGEVEESDTEKEQKRSPKRSGAKLDSPEVKPKQPRVSLSLKKDDGTDELNEEKELKVVLAMLPEKEPSKKTPEKTSDSEEDKKTPQKESNSEETQKTPLSKETKQTPKTVECSVNLTKAFLKDSATTSNSNQKEDSKELENSETIDLNASGGSDSSNKENKKNNERNGKEKGKSEEKLKKRESVNGVPNGEPMEVEEFPQNYNYSGSKTYNTPLKKSLEPESSKFEFTTPRDEVIMNCCVEISEEFSKHKQFENHVEVFEAQKTAEDRVYARMSVPPSALNPRRSPRLANHPSGDVEEASTSTTPTKLNILKSNENLNKSFNGSDKRVKVTLKDKLQEEIEENEFTTGDKDLKQETASEELLSDIEFNLSEDEESPTKNDNKMEELNKSLNSSVKDVANSSKQEVRPALDDEKEQTKESLTKVDSKDKSYISVSLDSSVTLRDSVGDGDNHVKTPRKESLKNRKSNSEDNLEKEKSRSLQESVSSEGSSIEEEIIEDSDEGNKSVSKLQDKTNDEEQTIPSSNETSPEVLTNHKSSAENKQVQIENKKENEDNEKKGAVVTNTSKIEHRRSKNHIEEHSKAEAVDRITDSDKDSANISKAESHTKEIDEEQRIDNSAMESDELNISKNKKNKKRKTSENGKEDAKNAETEPEDLQSDKKGLNQQKSSLGAENIKDNENQEVIQSQSAEETDEVNTSRRKSRSGQTKLKKQDEKNTKKIGANATDSEQKKKSKDSSDDESDSEFELPKIIVTKAKSQKKVTVEISRVDSESDKEADLEAKIDNLIERRLREDSESDESSEASVTHFLDDMAEEGDEDTPSEDSNAIIEEGESIGSSDSAESDSDNTYDGEDSFIDDHNDYTELLSGEEYDLTDEKETIKKKKKRIKVIEVSDSEEEEKEKKSPPSKSDKSPVGNKLEIDEAKKKLEKLKDKIEDDSDLDKMSTRPYCGLTPPSAVSIRDSLSDTEKIEINDDDSSSNLVINKEDNLRSLEELKQNVPVVENVPTEKVLEVNSDKATPIVFTPNNSLMTNQTPQSENTRKRHSSITIQENIKLKDIQEGTVGDRIVKVIDVFCSSVKGEQKDNTGNISLNISVEYLNNPTQGAENDLDDLKKNLSQEFSFKTDELDEHNHVKELEKAAALGIEKPELTEVKEPQAEIEDKSLKRKSPSAKDRKSLASNYEPSKTSASKKMKKQKKRDHHVIDNELPTTSQQSESLILLSDDESNLSGDLDKELNKKYFTASLEDLVNIEEHQSAANLKSKKDKKSNKSKKLKVVEKIEQKTNDEPIEKIKKLKRKAISTDQEGKIEHEVHQTVSPPKKDKKSKKAKSNDENINDSANVNIEESKTYVKETVQLEEHIKEKKTKRSSRSSLIPFKEEFSKPGLLPSKFFNTVTTVEMKPDKKKPTILPSTSTDKESWKVATLDTTLLPSSSSIKRKTAPTQRFHVKDFKNQMLYDTSRVPRVDTKVMLKKSQQMKY